MEITCPACAKRNDSADACVRCGCDLSVLRAILSCAMGHLASARRAFQDRDPAGALAHAERSWRLVHSAESARVAALAAALAGNAEALVRWRQRVENPPEPTH